MKEQLVGFRVDARLLISARLLMSGPSLLVIEQNTEKVKTKTRKDTEGRKGSETSREGSNYDQRREFLLSHFPLRTFQVVSFLHPFEEISLYFDHYPSLPFSFFFFVNFDGRTGPILGHIHPCFGFLVMSPLGFRARVWNFIHHCMYPTF